MIRTFRYGDAEAQAGDLHLPTDLLPPVVCLLHGGFWKYPYGREQMTAVANDLVARGFAVWNIGYRRVGENGGGWPGTMEDATAAVGHVASLSRDVVELDLHRVIVVGHSAGGQLALLAAAGSKSVRPVAAASLAGVLDLQLAHALDSGGGAVASLIGGGPESVPERYVQASPVARLPLGLCQLILHGERDEALPVSMARDYVRLARASGDMIDFVELPGSGHMDFLDPASAAHAALCDWLRTVSRRP